MGTLNTDSSSEKATILSLRIEAPDEERNELFFRERAVIGRHEQCDVVIQSGLVSRRHVEFFRHKDVWYLRDLDSTNGTWLNSERVEEQRLPVSGTIVLGTIGPKIYWQLQRTSSLSDSRMRLFRQQNKTGPGMDSTWLEPVNDQ